MKLTITADHADVLLDAAAKLAAALDTDKPWDEHQDWLVQGQVGLEDEAKYRATLAEARELLRTLMVGNGTYAVTG